VGVVLEVAQGGCEVAGLAAGEGEGAGGSADRADVTGVEFGEPLRQPAGLAVAEQELQQPARPSSPLPSRPSVSAGIIGTPVPSMQM
jgi:hypothetical protein